VRALAGLCLAATTTTGDANVGRGLTLLSIGAVIIGGGEFVGGIVSPIGTVFGALIMQLSGSLLSFASVAPAWQYSVQGGYCWSSWRSASFPGGVSRMKSPSLGRLLSQPWFYASAGAILVWLVIVGHSQGAGGGAVISAALNYSVFFAVVGLAQMLVMASGAGNIDLSVPANITLAAYLSTGQMVGTDSRAAGWDRRRAGRRGRDRLGQRAPHPRLSDPADGGDAGFRAGVESFTFVYSRISVAKPRPLAGGIHHGAPARHPICHAGRAHRLGHSGLCPAAIDLRPVAIRLRTEPARGLALRCKRAPYAGRGLCALRRVHRAGRASCSPALSAAPRSTWGASSY
jgi:hypothetical protein